MVLQALRKTKEDPTQSIAVEVDQIEALDKEIKDLKVCKKVQALTDYAYFRRSKDERTVTIKLKKTARNDKLNARRDGKLLTRRDAHYDYY